MDVFEALADGTRRQIVDLLHGREMAVAELCGQFEISQPAVSRHLRLLKGAGLVASRAQGQQRIYRLTPEPLAEVQAWLHRYRSFWTDRLDALGEVLEGGSEKQAQRQDSTRGSAAKRTPGKSHKGRKAPDKKKAEGRRHAARRKTDEGSTGRKARA